MRWDTLPRRLHYQDLKQQLGMHHHDITPTEIHVLIGLGALATVGMILAFLAWSFT